MIALAGSLHESSLVHVHLVWAAAGGWPRYKVRRRGRAIRFPALASRGRIASKMDPSGP
jgi:hypothetical protein